MTDELTKKYVLASNNVVEATDHLRDALQRFKKAIVNQASRMERGTAAVGALESVNASTLRQELAEAVDEFEAARHQMRVAFIAVALAEGSSMSDIARALGVSRQLVSRLAKNGDAG